jgi:hypothetical protein
MRLNQFLIQVISGGQTGVDTAGVEAARQCSIPTGGYMPKGFLRETGPAPDFREKYNMQATDLPDYPLRTEMNIRHSEGTIQIAGIWNSPGERLTSNLIYRFTRPVLMIEPKILGNRMRPWDRQTQRIISPKEIADWIVTNYIKTLNVAGNSESTWMGIYDWTLTLLLETFLTEID